MKAKNWNRVLVGELASPKKNALVGGPFGSDLVSRDYVAEGVPVIRGTNMGKGRWIGGDFVFVTEEKADALSANCARPGDLVFTQRGTIGQVALVPDAGPHRYLISQSQMKLTVDASKADSLFLFYVFNTSEHQDYIQQNAIRTGVPHTNLSILRNTPVRLPNLGIQRSIAAVFSSLDAKIELNQRLNAELEGLAKLLYDYWFVQYDFPISPAQAKAMGKPSLAGKPYRSSGGPMVFHPQLKREVPKGWEVGSLLDIATFTNGIACQKYPPTSDEFLRVIKIKEMRDGFTANSERVTPDVPEKVIVYDGDILFSWSASLEVMLWTGGTGALNQHIFKVTSDDYPRSFCYFTLQGYLEHFKMLADLRKTTMGHITREHLEQSRIAIPPKESAKNVETITKPIFDQIITHQQQSHHLAQLRDWLLPMLMNGQVRVG